MINEDRVRERARKLWEDAGRPKTGIDSYLDQASELVAIEDNSHLTRRPLRGDEVGREDEPAILGSDHAGPSGEPVEPIEPLDNLGEFPTLTDQGRARTRIGRAKS
jgi:hypothetical protein